MQHPSQHQGFREHVLERVIRIEQKVDGLMSALSDLEAIVTQVAADVQSVIAKLTSPGGPSDAQIEQVVTQLQGVDTALQGALNPPPPPTTTP